MRLKERIVARSVVMALLTVLLGTLCGCGGGIALLVNALSSDDDDASLPDAPPVVKALKSAVKDVLGLEGRPMGIGGGTVAAFFRRAGFPAAVWLKCGHSAHQPDEHCPVDFMLDNAKVFARLFSQPV